MSGSDEKEFRDEEDVQPEGEHDSDAFGVEETEEGPRAEAVRRAIRSGHYRVDPDRLAATMLHHPERPLNPSERDEG